MYCCWEKMEAKGAGTCDWENQEAGAIYIYIYIYIYFVLSPPFPTVLSLSSYRPKGISKIPIKSDFLPFFGRTKPFE
jgi:hypothetical protein